MGRWESLICHDFALRNWQQVHVMVGPLKNVLVQRKIDRISGFMENLLDVDSGGTSASLT